MAPLYGLILIVIVFPELWAFYLSFTDYSVGQAAHIVGMANYSEALQASEFWNSAARTLVFAAIAVSLEISAGLCLSCILNRRMAIARPDHCGSDRANCDEPGRHLGDLELSS